MVQLFSATILASLASAGEPICGHGTFATPDRTDTVREMEAVDWATGEVELLSG
jgi:hypothetical protein